MTQLNPVEQAALIKAVRSMPKALPVGEHEIDMTVRVQGTLTKGADYDSATYQAIPFDKLFMIAMSKLNNITVDSIVKEALESEELDTSEVKNKVKEVIAALTEKVVKTQSGKTTARLSVSKIEVPV